MGTQIKQMYVDRTSCPAKFSTHQDSRNHALETTSFFVTEEENFHFSFHITHTHTHTYTHTNTHTPELSWNHKVRALMYRRGQQTFHCRASLKYKSPNCIQVKLHVSSDLINMPQALLCVGDTWFSEAHLLATPSLLVLRKGPF